MCPTPLLVGKSVIKLHFFLQISPLYGPLIFITVKNFQKRQSQMRLELVIIFTVFYFLRKMLHLFLKPLFLLTWPFVRLKSR